MLLLFLTVNYFCVVYFGQNPTRACVVLLFKMPTINKAYLIYLILSYLTQSGGKVYSIQLYLMKFANDLRRAGC